MSDFSIRYRAAASIAFVGLDALADGARVDSANYDNGTNRDIEASIKVRLAGASAAATGIVRLELKRSHENADFEDSGNSELLGIVQMSGTAPIVAVVEGVRLSPHQKVSIVNTCGAALSGSGNSVELIGITYTDA